MSLTSSEKVLFADAKSQKTPQLNFYHCIKPLHMISKAFGLLPFKVHTQVNGKMDQSVGAIDIIRFVGCIVINLILSYHAQTSPRSTAIEGKTILYFSYRLVWFCQIVICIMSIVLDMVNRHRFLEILRAVTAFDKNVKLNFDWEIALKMNLISPGLLVFRSNHLEFLSILNVRNVKFGCLLHFGLQLMHCWL